MSSAVSTEPEIALEIGLGGGFVKKKQRAGRAGRQLDPSMEDGSLGGELLYGEGEGGEDGGCAPRDVRNYLFIFGVLELLRRCRQPGTKPSLASQVARAFR